MIRYAILIDLKPEAPAGAAEAILEAVRQLPAKIPAIREYEAGVGINAGNASLSIVALFDDLDGFAQYRDHPEHQTIARDLLLPVLARSCSTQFEI